MNAISLADKLSTFPEYYQPRMAPRFNGNDGMVIKARGPFTWHETDDFFFVLKGGITIQTREGNVTLSARS
jgi:hypothetical protein